MTVTVRGRASLPAPDSVPHRRWAAWLLLAYLLPLTVLVLAPRLGENGVPQIADAILAWTRDTGPLPGLRYGVLEAAANILLFAPIGFLVSGMVARRPGSPRDLRHGIPDWSVWLLTTALSAAIELTQVFLLTERSGTVRDLWCNSAGALAGVLAFRLVQSARHRSIRENREKRKNTP